MNKPTLAERVRASHPVTCPRVEVHIHPSRSKYDRYWVLTLDRCPHCEKPHSHGGGSLDHPPALGHRLSHCVTRRPLDYELISSIEEVEP
jgi:hypothetical protein